MKGWNPIAIAPKDGRRLYLFGTFHFIGGWSANKNQEGWAVINGITVPENSPDAPLWWRPTEKPPSTQGHIVAYADRALGFIFVPEPGERGRYLRTDASVIRVACPHCRTPVGVPCSGKQGYMSGTHAIRRKVAWKNHKPPEDKIDPADGASDSIEP